MEAIPELIKLVCKKCGKIITSLSENQAEQNLKVHMMTHDKKE